MERLNFGRFFIIGGEMLLVGIFESHRRKLSQCILFTPMHSL